MNKKKRIFALLAAFAISSIGTIALAQHQQRPPPGERPATMHGQPGEHAPNGGATGEHGEHKADNAAEHADEAAEGGEHAEHAAHEHGPEAINWTDFSDHSRPAYLGLLINFGILLALYYTMGKKGVVDGLKQRRVDIAKEIEEAAAVLAEAKERAKKYQGDLKNADVDAATAKASLVSAGKGEVEKMLSEAEEKAERMKRDAERLVDQERKQLKADLLQETIEKAVDQAQKLLEKQATSEDHARLAQELLAELARKPAAPRRTSMPVPNSVRPPTSGGAT